MPRPVEVFFSYAHEDEALMHEIRRQLVVFDRQGVIRKWHDGMIPPGNRVARLDRQSAPDFPQPTSLRSVVPHTL